MDMLGPGSLRSRQPSKSCLKTYGRSTKSSTAANANANANNNNNTSSSSTTVNQGQARLFDWTRLENERRARHQAIQNGRRAANASAKRAEELLYSSHNAIPTEELEEHDDEIELPRRHIPTDARRDDLGLDFGFSYGDLGNDDLEYSPGPTGKVSSARQEQRVKIRDDTETIVISLASERNKVNDKDEGEDKVQDDTDNDPFGESPIGSVKSSNTTYRLAHGMRQQQHKEEHIQEQDTSPSDDGVLLRSPSFELRHRILSVPRPHFPSPQADKYGHVARGSTRGTSISPVRSTKSTSSLLQGHNPTQVALSETLAAIPKPLRSWKEQLLELRKYNSNESSPAVLSDDSPSASSTPTGDSILLASTPLSRSSTESEKDEQRVALKKGQNFREPIIIDSPKEQRTVSTPDDLAFAALPITPPVPRPRPQIRSLKRPLAFSSRSTTSSTLPDVATRVIPSTSTSCSNSNATMDATIVSTTSTMFDTRSNANTPGSSSSKTFHLTNTDTDTDTFALSNSTRTRFPNNNDRMTHKEHTQLIINPNIKTNTISDIQTSAKASTKRSIKTNAKPITKASTEPSRAPMVPSTTASTSKTTLITKPMTKQPTANRTISEATTKSKPTTKSMTKATIKPFAEPMVKQPTPKATTNPKTTFASRDDTQPSAKRTKCHVESLRADDLAQLLEICNQHFFDQFRQGKAGKMATTSASRDQVIDFESMVPTHLIQSLSKIGEASFSEVFTIEIPPKGDSGRPPVLDPIEFDTYVKNFRRDANTLALSKGGSANKSGAIKKTPLLTMKVIPFTEDSGLEPSIPGHRRRAKDIALADLDILHLQDVYRETMVSAHVIHDWPGFIGSFGAMVVRGKYPKPFLNAWDRYRKEIGTESVRPDVYKADQLYCVIMLPYGGVDLEHFPVQNWQQAWTVMAQIAGSLQARERGPSWFEHRDMHWGNVLVKETHFQTWSFPMGSQNGHSNTSAQEEISIPTFGITTLLIDFTLARVQRDRGGLIYMDMEEDTDLFRGKGDYQFDIYRKMRKLVSRDWSLSQPRTNVFWLHYIADKLLKEKKLEPPSTRTTVFDDIIKKRRKGAGTSTTNSNTRTMSKSRATHSTATNASTAKSTTATMTTTKSSSNAGDLFEEEWGETRFTEEWCFDRILAVWQLDLDRFEQWIANSSSYMQAYSNSGAVLQLLLDLA
ncbi:hypothetical protein BGZ94_002923 [Podila epigama]|nr:hypothetical protein BGZ94_002923 [Podila epigama]